MYNINTRLIKSEIYKKGYTIQNIAEQLNINPQTLSNWLNNRNLCNITKFIELLYMLDIDIKNLTEKKEGRPTP